jgi:DNA polymerase III epsilon subunit-like protein
VLLSIEVTGFGPSAQIVEICIAEARSGHVTFRTRIDPTVPIRPQAMRLHGITEAALAGMPRYAQVAKAVSEALDGKAVVGYDTKADLRILRQTCQAAGVPVPSWGEAVSLMDVWALVHGRRVGLSEACSEASLEFEKPLVGGMAKCEALGAVLGSLLPGGRSLEDDGETPSIRKGA